MSAPTARVDEGTEVAIEDLEKVPLLERGGPGELAAKGWQPSWVQAHGIMLVSTVIFSIWNCASRLVGKSDASSLAFAFFRMLGASTLLACLQCTISPRECLVSEWRTNWIKYATMGVLLSSGQLCLLAGSALTSATTLATIQCVEPSIAALLGFMSGMEEPSAMPRRLLAATVAGLGAAVILFLQESEIGPVLHGSFEHGMNGQNFDHVAGCGLLLAQVCCNIFYYLIQTKLFETGSSTRTPLLVTTCSCGCAVPVLLVLVVLNVLVIPVDVGLTSFHKMSLVFTEHPTHGGLSPLDALVFAILFASTAGNLLWATANKRLEASELIIYKAVQLPMTAVMSSLLLGEHMGPFVAIGAVIIGGALLVQ